MSANNGAPLVKVRDLRKSFGQNEVLRGVDLDVARGLPLITLIFFVYYAMPALKVNVSGWWAAVAALAAFETAHVAEVTRGALQSIHPGQTEAGRAIGLTFARRML